MISTEVLVIGAGPGGYVAAIKLGQLGKKTLLVDRDKLGGECLNYGCIPSKALISTVNAYYKAKKASDVGVTADNFNVDWAKVIGWKAKLVEGFSRNVGSLCKGNGVEILMGSAKFTGPKTAEVTTANGVEQISFQNAIIVTGSRPLGLPNLKLDGSDVIGSKESLELKEKPARLLVVGGGVIGLEIGTFYAKLGTQVTVVEITGQLLPGVDPDLVAPVARSLQKIGATVHLNSKVLSYAKVNGSLEISLETPDGPKAIAVDKILLSVGRAPNVDGLGLEAAGVKSDPKGFIPVNSRQETNVAGIYAAGDVSGPPYLAHKASREGILAALAIAGKDVEPRGAIPWAVFSDPEVAFVGMSDAEAKAKGIETTIGRFPFLASGRAQTARETDGFVKLVAEKSTGKLLGAGIVGPDASDLIAEAALGIRLGATLHDLASTIHTHPTLSETLMEAAEAGLGQPIHILPPRKA